MTWLPSTSPEGYGIEKANRNALIIRRLLEANASKDIEFGMSHFTFFQKSTHTHELKARLPIDLLNYDPYSVILGLTNGKDRSDQLSVPMKQAHFHKVNCLSFLESLTQITPLLQEELKVLFKDTHVTAVVKDESSIATKALQRFCQRYGSSTLKFYTARSDKSKDLSKVTYKKSYQVDELESDIPSSTNKWSRLSFGSSTITGSRKFTHEILDLFGDRIVIKDLYNEGLESPSFKSAVRVSIINSEANGKKPLVELTTQKRPIHDLYIDFAGPQLPSVNIKCKVKKPYVYNTVVNRRLMLVNRDWSPENPQCAGNLTHGPTVDYTDSNFTDFLFEGIPITVSTRSTWRSVTILDWKIVETYNGEPVVFRMPSLERLTITAVGSPGCDWPVFRAPGIKQVSVVFTKQCIDIVGHVNRLFHDEQEPQSLLKLSISSYKNASDGVIESYFKPFIYRSLRFLAIENISAHSLLSSPHCPGFDSLEIIEYEPLSSYTLDEENLCVRPAHQEFSPSVYPTLKRVHLCKTFQDEAGFSPSTFISLRVPETCHSIQRDNSIRMPVCVNGEFLKTTLLSLLLPCVSFNRMSGNGMFREDLDSTGRFKQAPKEE